MSRQLHEGLNAAGYSYVFSYKETDRKNPKYHKFHRIDNSKSVRLLGLNFDQRPTKEFLVEMAVSMINQGMLPLPNKLGGTAKL